MNGQVHQVVVTRGALAALDRNGENLAALLCRHDSEGFTGLDPSAVSVVETVAWTESDTGEVAFQRTLHAYRLDDQTKVWIISAPDRLETTVLLPEEYQTSPGAWCL